LAKFDFAQAVRWARFAPRRALARRKDDELPFLGETASGGGELLLDSCVYIDGLQGRSPDVVADLLEMRISNHSTVAIQELMHAVGALDPAHPGTKKAVRQIGVVIDAMPAHRIVPADPDVLGRAALLSGILSRLQGYRNDDRLRALHDCALFLQAQKLGATLLTANTADFDLLLQLIPAGRVLFYRRTEPAGRG
jgi:hypothetical protein